ncbi:MAG: hypothetical protein K2X27_19560 [Candidatus Obscuribacterales bacterium]|nr:hypothetical protein [Candidatus Obscuribacterales bacterium]
MRKQSHLSLVASNDLSVVGESLSGIRPAVAAVKQTLKQRIKKATEELSAMQELTESMLYIMKALPMDEICLEDLKELELMFRETSFALETYSRDFSKQDQNTLTASDKRQLKKLLQQITILKKQMPEAAGFVAEIGKTVAKTDTAQNKVIQFLQPPQR